MEKQRLDWTLTDIISRHGTSTRYHAGAGYNFCESISEFDQAGIVKGSFQLFTCRDIEITMVDMDLQQPLGFHIDDGMERVTTTVLFNGRIASDCLLDRKYRKVEHARHMLCYSFNNNNGYQMQPGRLSLFNLNINPRFFFEIAGNDDKLTKVFDGQRPEEYCLSIPLPFDRAGHCNHIIQSVYANRFTGITRNLYLESKAYELFSVQLNELISDTGSRIRPIPVSRVDSEKLIALHDHITANFTEPLSLAGLSARFGINQFKLKKGYKMLFGKTVFGHIYQLKMALARELLLAGELNIAEVAYSVGYNSPANLSTAFSNMFNYPPSRISTKLTW